MKTILEIVVGSTLHGTAVQDGLEDLDMMAVVLEDFPQFAGFHPKDTWTQRTKPEGVRSEAGDTDFVAYGLKKYLQLALKGNPTILQALFVPDEFIRTIIPEGQALQSLAPKIVSKAVYWPFKGYMEAQHRRLVQGKTAVRVTRPELIEKYGYDTKYAAHIVRLSIQGAELLRTGKLTLPLQDEARKLCVDVRNGYYSLEEVSSVIDLAERRLKRAFEESTLPEKPDTEAVEAWMLKTYLGYWNEQNQTPQASTPPALWRRFLEP